MTDLKEKSNAGTSTSASATFRNTRLDSSPVRHRRLFMKETVPTALVSPQTIQVKVQPPMVPYRNFRQRSPITSTPHQRNYSNEFGSDLSFSQTSFAVQSKLSAPNSSNSLHEDHAAISSSSNISMFSDNNTLNFAESDDRLESLEQRLRFLEARLHDYESVHGRNLRPQSAHSSCTNLMNNNNTYHVLSHNNCSGSISSINNNSFRNQEMDILKDKIRKLQMELDSERRLRDKQLKENSKQLLWKVDENKTLRCRVRELETENQLWQERFHSYNNLYYQPNAVEDLLQEKETLLKTINDLNAKLEQQDKINNNKLDEYPEDQYVSIDKYRCLKAKSKKLLSEKCRSLRTEILEKESIKVQLQLQNTELSELRKAVYESKCDCINNNTGKIREEILKAAQNCHFAASCLLGVCEDIVAKKTPDYDQILGLKSSMGVSISDQKWDHKILDNSQMYNGQLFSHMQNLNNDLIRMQRLMVDYYTNELVDTIDCRLQ